MILGREKNVLYCEDLEDHFVYAINGQAAVYERGQNTPLLIGMVEAINWFLEKAACQRP